MLLFQVTDKWSPLSLSQDFFRLWYYTNIVVEHLIPKKFGVLYKGWYPYLRHQRKLRHGGECPPY